MLIRVKIPTHILAAEGLHEVTEAEAFRLIRMGVAEAEPEKKKAPAKKKKKTDE